MQHSTTNTSRQPQQACKEAKIGYSLVLSTCTGPPGSLFGRHFVNIEEAAKKSGLNHTIVRLQYMDANFQYLINDGVMCDARDPNAMTAFGNLEDTVAACVNLLLHPEEARHHSKVYQLLSKPTTIQRICDERGIKYQRITYEDSLKTYLGFGMGEWQAKGLMELFQLMDEGAFNIVSNDVSNILGRT